MEQYIPKSALVAEIERRIAAYRKNFDKVDIKIARILTHGKIEILKNILSFLDTLEVKEIKEKETPKYGYLETVYYCGSEPRWKVGDILAEYQMYSDREGEYVHGEVVKVEYDEEYNDWYYTFKDGERLFEELLLTSDVYKKN